MPPLIWILTILSLLFGTGVFSVERAEAQTAGRASAVEDLQNKIKAKQDKIKEIEAQIETYKKNIAAKQQEALTLQNQLSILENRRAKIELDIEATTEAIAGLDLEIQTLELGILEKQERIEKDKALLAGLVRALARFEVRSPLEILLSEPSFSTFFNQMRYMQDVNRTIGDTVRMIENDKTALEEQKTAREQKRATLSKLKDDLEGKKDALQGATSAKANLLAQTAASEQKFRVLVTKLRREYQAIENEIVSLERDVRLQLERQHKLIPEDGMVFSWPVPSKYVTAEFHDPEYPYRYVFEHPGVDIRAGQGTPVTASASGYVARAKDGGARGYSYVMLVHPEGFATVYGHLSRIAVAEDSFVSRGSVVGYSGATPGTAGAGPFTTGPHLHFEIRLNGIPVNPLNYLAD